MTPPASASRPTLISRSRRTEELLGEKERLEALGLQVKTAEHAWVHWRSLYMNDPEGNMVELVCYDGSV
jgi:catechol-2,3-dioxygenase